MAKQASNASMTKMHALQQADWEDVEDTHCTCQLENPLGMQSAKTIRAWHSVKGVDPITLVTRAKVEGKELCNCGCKLLPTSFNP